MDNPTQTPSTTAFNAWRQDDHLGNELAQVRLQRAQLERDAAAAAEAEAAKRRLPAQLERRERELEYEQATQRWTQEGLSAVKAAGDASNKAINITIDELNGAAAELVGLLDRMATIINTARAAYTVYQRTAVQEVAGRINAERERFSAAALADRGVELEAARAVMNARADVIKQLLPAAQDPAAALVAWVGAASTPKIRLARQLLLMAVGLQADPSPQFNAEDASNLALSDLLNGTRKPGERGTADIAVNGGI